MYNEMKENVKEFKKTLNRICETKILSYDTKYMSNIIPSDGATEQVTSK